MVFVLMLTATAGGRPLSTALTGAAEVPGPNDANGSGCASFTLNPSHAKPALTSPSKTSRRSPSRTSTSGRRTSPTTYYFNVHSANFPLGALRGQLSR
jgi:hypothetical protein